MKHQVDFLELLQIDYEKYPVIAVVGGGGKTSLIYRLTDELIDKGKRVIITRLRRAIRQAKRCQIRSTSFRSV